MKRPIIAVLLATAVTLPAFAALKQGDAAPEFAAQASLAGKTFAFSLADARRHGPVVVYFYPAAFTEGCNVQAHEFAVKMEKFQAAGATVIGVSLDNGFKDTRGVEVGHGFAERTTFVVSSDGIIAATIGGLAPATNVDRALAAVQRLAGAGQPAKK